MCRPNASRGSEDQGQKSATSERSTTQVEPRVAASRGGLSLREAASHSRGGMSQSQTLSKSRKTFKRGCQKCQDQGLGKECDHCWICGSEEHFSPGCRLKKKQVRPTVNPRTKETRTETRTHPQNRHEDNGNDTQSSNDGGLQSSLERGENGEEQLTASQRIDPPRGSRMPESES